MISIDDSIEEGKKSGNLYQWFSWRKKRGMIFIDDSVEEQRRAMISIVDWSNFFDKAEFRKQSNISYTRTMFVVTITIINYSFYIYFFPYPTESFIVNPTW